MVANTACYAYPRSHYVLTPQDWDTILQHLQDGFSFTGAARSVGATRQAIYERINRDPQFAQAVRECHEEGSDFYEDRMRTLSLGPQGFLPTIATLKARRREKWGDKQEITQNTNVRIQFVPAPTAAQLIEADMRILQDSVPDGTDALRITAGEDDSSEAYDADSLP